MVVERSVVGETSSVGEKRAIARKEGPSICMRCVLIWTSFVSRHAQSRPPQALRTTIDFFTVVTNICKRPFLNLIRFPVPDIIRCQY